MLFPLGVQRWGNGGVLMIVKPVVRSVAVSVLKALRAFERWFATFNGVSQYVSIPPVTLPGDFEISMWMRPTAPSSNDAFLADAHGATYYFRLHNNTQVAAFVAGQSYYFSGDAFPTEGFDLAITLTGTTLACFVNDQQHGVTYTITPFTGENNFKIGSANSASKFFNGQIRDLKIWSGGNRDTGTLIRDYPLDDGWSKNPIIRNSATPLGANLYTHGDALNTPPVAQYDVIVGGYDLATTKPIVIEFEIQDLPVDGQILGRFGGSDITITESGVYKHVNLSPSGNNMIFQERTTGLSAGVSIVNVKVCEAEGVGQAVNMTEASWSEG